jgi:hypothetical protein
MNTSPVTAVGPNFLRLLQNQSRQTLRAGAHSRTHSMYGHQRRDRANLDDTRGTEGRIKMIWQESRPNDHMSAGWCAAGYAADSLRPSGFPGFRVCQTRVSRARQTATVYSLTAGRHHDYQPSHYDPPSSRLSENQSRQTRQIRTRSRTHSRGTSGETDQTRINPDQTPMTPGGRKESLRVKMIWPRRMAGFGKGQHRTFARTCGFDGRTSSDQPMDRGSDRAPQQLARAAGRERLRGRCWRLGTRLQAIADNSGTNLSMHPAC